MCIRDRLRTLQGQANAIPDSVAGVRNGNDIEAQVVGQVPEGRVVPTCPVSYTHLTLPTICSV
eukprot:3652797-Prorocentrum_lima.AAC.1